MEMSGDGRKMNTFFLASVAFSFFIVCPRMAGMTGIIANSSQINAVYLAVAGTLISLPLIVAMVIIFQKYGITAALAFSVLTDLGAAYFMKEISLKAGVETFIYIFVRSSGLESSFKGFCPFMNLLLLTNLISAFRFQLFNFSFSFLDSATNSYQ